MQLDQTMSNYFMMSQSKSFIKFWVMFDAWRYVFIARYRNHTHLMLTKVKQFSKAVIELWTEITDLNLLLHSWKKYERSSRISHASLQFIFNISGFENCYFNHLLYIIHYRSKVSARLMFLLTILFLIYKNYDIIYFSEIFNKVANYQKINVNRNYKYIS